MSLINQMLRDLEERQAPEEAALANEVRPLPEKKSSIAPKIVVAGILLLALAGGGVWWNRSVHELAEQPPTTVPPISAISLPVIDSSSPAAVPAKRDASLVKATPSPPTSSLAKQTEAGAEANPLPQTRPAPATATVLSAPASIAAIASPSRVPASERLIPDPRLKVSNALSPLPPSAERGNPPSLGEKPTLIPTSPTTGPVVIEKQVRLATARERAENEYRKALQLMNHGNGDEAIARLRAALQEDATFAPARQTLAGILVERRKLDEAQAVLEEGLTQNPAQPNLAIRAARIHVERGDLQAAHEALQRSAAAGDKIPDYRALHAGILQRLGQHRAAGEEYQAALRMAPQMDVWWMGLGISLEAEGRGADARVAFLRAREGGSLSSDLDSFVEQKLRQLQ